MAQLSDTFNCYSVFEISMLHVLKFKVLQMLRDIKEGGFTFDNNDNNNVNDDGANTSANILILPLLLK